MASVPSKDEVLAKLDGLTYQQRAHYAATVGRLNATSPALPALINDMRKVYILSFFSFITAIYSFIFFCSTPLPMYHNMKLMKASQKCFPNNRLTFQSTITKTTLHLHVLQYLIIWKCWRRRSHHPLFFLSNLLLLNMWDCRRGKQERIITHITTILISTKLI